MRRSIVAVLAVLEVFVTCAIFTCSLQLSHRIARSETLGAVASVFLRSTRTFASSTRSFAASTRRIAENGVQVHITIGNA